MIIGRSSRINIPATISFVLTPKIILVVLLRYGCRWVWPSLKEKRRRPLVAREPVEGLYARQGGPTPIDVSALLIIQAYLNFDFPVPDKIE